MSVPQPTPTLPPAPAPSPSFIRAQPRHLNLLASMIRRKHLAYVIPAEPGFQTFLTDFTVIAIDITQQHLLI
jgi:hypothetical protein